MNWVYWRNEHPNGVNGNYRARYLANGRFEAQRLVDDVWTDRPIAMTKEKEEESMIGCILQKSKDPEQAEAARQLLAQRYGE
jgi:hypothetical protein